MHFLIQNQKDWVLRPKSHFGTYSSFYKTAHILKINGSPTCMHLFHKQNFTKSCANAIEAFHRALGGCTFRHEKVGNGGNVTCPIISEYTIGLRPFHAAPHFNKSKHEFIMNCLMNLAKHRQFRALKMHQWKAKEPRDSALTCRE